MIKNLSLYELKKSHKDNLKVNEAYSMRHTLKGLLLHRKSFLYIKKQLNAYKILLMIRIFLFTDDLKSGGAERQISYLAIGLKKAGCDVRLIQFYDHPVFYKNDLEPNDIHTETITEGKNGFKRAFVIKRLVKQWNPDMVVCYKPGTCIAGCLARMMCKFNLVVSERNTTQKLTKSEKLRFALYRFADHIIPNSYSQAEFIKNHFPILMPKVKVITNMIDTGKFSPPLQRPNNEIPQVITTARIAPQKNVLIYLEAIAILKRRGIKAHFNWYGRIDGSKEYWEKIKDKIEDLKIQDFITFHGATPNPQYVYNKSDLFILPSLYEGFPNVLCEAMACELPAIATGVCDSPRILKDKNWLISPHSPNEMAEKIEEMLNLSEKERIKIGKTNRGIIINLCSPQKFLESYVSLY